MDFAPRRWLTATAALAAAIVLGCALLAASARAEGSPSINLTVAAPASVLYGANATVTLTAANPAAQPYGYNLSYRVVLPEGISYVAGSGHSSAGALEPQAFANEPEKGKTTLIWSNVADLSPGSSNAFSLEVKQTTSHFTIGAKYAVEAGAYVAEQARYLPKFSATGVPEGPSSTSFTGYATGSATTTITALQITQAEESPAGQILRGVHDHQVTYKLTVTNTSVNATGKVVVEDWLPADLEYLGCGGAGADHTTDAPTNPGSAEEYPGSGLITVPALGGCLTPTGVETLMTDPDGAEEDPDAVYTHVSWSLGTLAAGETRSFEFRAAVPLRENTTTWTAKEPTVASGEQATNLNNNSGAETKDGESVVTFAKVGGEYDETTAVSASGHLTRVAKDLTIEKSASSKTLAEGQVTQWTLTLHSSEYRYNTAAVVTDTVPDGLCPLSSENLTKSSECEPNTAPSSPYASAVEEANGTWKLVWNESSDKALAQVAQNATTTITYDTKTRTHYQHEHLPAGPILADDTVTNNVLAQASTNVVCGNDTDCSGTGETPINHERPLSEPVSDTSSASQTSEGPSITKEIAKSGTGCLADEYTTSVPVFHPGDLICWRLIASFPTTIDTKGLNVTDFLPIADTFDEGFEEDAEKGQARGPHDTLPGTTFDHAEASSTEPGGSIAWKLPEEGYVNNEKQRFERVYATNARLPREATLGELQGNLMKFANVNTPGQSFAYRAEADYKLQFPQLSLAKQIVEINKKAVTPTSTATIKADDEATFALTVTNAGQLEADGVEVWDELPAGLTCADITAISAKGTCGSGRIEWGETHLGQEEVTVAAEGDAVLHFTVRIPATIDPADTLEDHAGVVKYESATNTGGQYLYVPAENIDALRDSEANMPAANAHAALETEDVKLQKTSTSSVVETGNTAAQATIGELVTYEVSVTIPAGTTLSGIAKLTDPALPKEQLTLKAGSVEALVNGKAAGVTFKAEESGSSPLVVFPEGYGAPIEESVKVTMRFVTTVANVAVNVHGKSIANTGKLTWTDPITGAQAREASDSVPIVEPSITLTETNNAGGKPAHGGQLVEYKLKAKDAEGASTAFDTTVIDTVPTGMTVSNASGTPYAEGETIESGGVWDEKTRTITWSVTSIEPNKETALVYYATVNEKPVSATILTDHAVATTTSMNGGISGKRTAENDPISGKAGYEAKAESSLEVAGATIEKKSDSAKATIGHRITYTLTVTLPADVVAYNETVIDTLPTSLDFDEYISAECTSGCPPAVTVQTYEPKINGSNTTSVAWYLGNIESASVARTMTIVYRADVRSSFRGGGEVKATDAISNSADVYYDKTNKRSFEEGNIPAPAEFDAKSGPASTTSTVVEPAVTLTKEASVDGGAYSTGPITMTDGDSVRYRLKLSNTGGVAAYGVEAKDLIPAQLTEVKETTNSADVTQSWSEGKPEIRWKLKGPLAAGSAETVELGYEAKLVSVKSLEPGEEFANAASVPGHYFGVPEAEREAGYKNDENKDIAYREYTGPSAAVKAKVALPTITVTKTTGAAGFPTSAPAEVGQAFTWRVIVKNTSTVAAKDVHVTDTLPANWEYVKGASFSKGGAIEPTLSGTLSAGEELTWATTIELAGGAETILTYQAKPLLEAESSPGSGAAHPNKNSASVSVLDAAGHSEDAKGPFAAGPAQAQGILDIPVLEVSKHALKESVAAGAEDSYTITIHNSGTGVAREVLAEDKLPPAGMSYKAKSATCPGCTGFIEKSASGSSIVWEIESIAAGASIEIKVTVETEATLESGRHLTNSVAVHASAAPTPVEASGTITLTTSADVEAAKKVSSGKAVPGDTLTYEVAATNHGPSTAREVKLVDHLPSGLTYESSSAGCEYLAGVVTCHADDIEPKDTKAFQIEVLLAPGLTGTISNTVRAESTTPDPEPANNEATAKTTLFPQAELELKKESLTPEVHDGERARFSLTATNSGPSDATEVKITDILPTGLEYFSATGTGASCEHKGQEVICTFVAPLAVDAHVSVELVTQTSGPGRRVNIATVTSAAEDLEPANNTAKAEVEVLPSADLRLEKKASPTFVKADGEVTYTLTVENKGPDAAKKVVVSDELPAGESFRSSADCTHEGQHVSCEVGDTELASGQTRTVALTVLMEVSLAEHSVVNTAEVTSETFDPDLANNIASAEVQVETAADLQLTKMATPESVDVGGEVTYTLLATNAGPDTVKGATVTDHLPAGELYLSNDASCSDVGQTVTCSLGDLPDEATRTIQIVVRIELALAGQTVTNTAEATSETPDPDEANNKAQAEITVEPAADLKLTKTVAIEGEGATLALPGKAIYTLLVENAGPDAAADVVVSDPLPAGETYIESDAGCTAAGQTVTCALGELADGEARTIHLTVSVGLSLGERTVTNTATVSSPTFDPSPAESTSSASLQTGPAADVAIVKTGPASVVSGATITWTLKVTDNGPSTAQQVVVEDPLPSGVTLTGATSTQGACQSTGNVLRCELGTLADGAVAEVEPTGTVTATSGTLHNTATVSALEPDPEPANNSSTATTTVLPAPVKEVVASNATGARARVSLRKLADRTTVRPGEEIGYRLIVRDLSSVPARKVRVCDALPSQTTVVDRGGGHLASERICFALSTLAAGASHTFKITLRADSNARQSILNRASASGANFNTVHAHVSTAVEGSARALRESGVTG
jgi:large repetitive protein